MLAANIRIEVDRLLDNWIGQKIDCKMEIQPGKWRCKTKLALTLAGVIVISSSERGGQETLG